MILNKIGQNVEIKGKKFVVGMLVCANEKSDYAGLYGHVIEILDDHDKYTDIEGTEIVCNFDTEYLRSNSLLTHILEKRFSELHGTSKTIDELPLDSVVMNSEMLDVGISDPFSIEIIRTYTWNIELYAIGKDEAQETAEALMEEFEFNEDDAQKGYLEIIDIRLKEKL